MLQSTDIQTCVYATKHAHNFAYNLRKALFGCEDRLVRSDFVQTTHGNAQSYNNRMAMTPL